MSTSMANLWKHTPAGDPDGGLCDVLLYFCTCEIKYALSCMYLPISRKVVESKILATALLSSCSLHISFILLKYFEKVVVSVMML